jgi:thiol-disulfide isomerase/thioredoxin
MATRMPSLSGAIGWLNSPPLTPSDLRGRVVLADFWTYTCVNWLRTLPYLRAWDQKYRDSGLVILGIHTPEFSFEKDIDNVRRAVQDMGIEYPVAVDSDYAIWRAFDNHYWPAAYLIDAGGNIRHHHFGEGAYAETEAVLQQLLAEAGAVYVDQDLVSVDASGTEVEADWSSLRTPETYVGYLRGASLALSVDESALGHPYMYEVPPTLKLNQWAPNGEWTIGDESVSLNGAHGAIAVHFHARDLNLVMGPATPGTEVPFRVLVDGHAPGNAHGSDIDEEGNGILSEQRLYQLVRQPGEVDDRRFEIEFDRPGVEAYVFTFG